jgi:hypothetical protein
LASAILRGKSPVLGVDAEIREQEFDFSAEAT